MSADGRARGLSRAGASALAAGFLAAGLAGCIPLDLGRETGNDSASIPPAAEPSAEPTPDPVFTNAAGAETPEPGVLVSQGGTVSGTVRFETTAGVTLLVFDDVVVDSESLELKVLLSAGDVVRNPDGYWWVDGSGSTDIGYFSRRGEGRAQVAVPERVNAENYRSVTIYDPARKIALGSAQLKL